VPEDPREAFYHERVRECGPSYKGFDLPSTEAALNLAYTYDVLHQSMSRYMADFGLSKSTFNILMILRHGNPEGMLLHNLGELLLVSRANITGLVDHLEQKGYAKRVVDEQDRRARFARITRKGSDLLDLVVPLHFNTIHEMFGGLDNGEKEQLTELLRKARASMSRVVALPVEAEAAKNRF
jgi:MarR family transcriptional regulator, 2-MHQ and catechol-resistance regulon repressor